MPTRRTESTHESDPAQPLPAKDPRSWLESPSADRMQGANGLPHDPDASAPLDHDAPAEPDAWRRIDRAEAGADTDDAGGDQDIDTAGTDADPDSPTKAMGTGIAPDRNRG